MDKINFEDLPSTNTPINADNLNDLQDNVDNAKLEKTITVTEANQDLNDYIEEGRYYFYGNTPTNSPSGVGWLDVYANSSENTIKQIYYRSSGINGRNEFMTFVRLKNAGTWSAWERYATEHDCYYIAGDSFTDYIKSPAVLSNNFFRFQIPLVKPVKSGVNATVEFPSNVRIFQDVLLEMGSYVSAIEAAVNNTQIELTVRLSGKPSDYTANKVAIADVQCKVTFS